MDPTLALPPKAAIAAPLTPAPQRYVDTTVPAVKALDGAATLPAERPFVAQVVNARLSGGNFPETASEIAPPDRTLRPYNVPMLPFEREEPVPEASDTETDPAATDDAVTTRERPGKAADDGATATPEPSPASPQVATMDAPEPVETTDG
ncbi:hypothetical protein [Yoonia sp. SS1-5]|uniref:DUF3035 domain-containing protein n=1 Tax=Yoonia rhodophyticola TaxID=3137370 RepID=A0AAN0NI34_9RHOB